MNALIVEREITEQMDKLVQERVSKTVPVEVTSPATESESSHWHSEEEASIKMTEEAALESEGG